MAQDEVRHKTCHVVNGRPIADKITQKRGCLVVPTKQSAVYTIAALQAGTPIINVMTSS